MNALADQMLLAKQALLVVSAILAMGTGVAVHQRKYGLAAFLALTCIGAMVNG